MSGHFHPDDMSKFMTVTQILQETTGQLNHEEILHCCCSYTYRLWFPIDQRYHQILQHCLPLTVDEDKRTVHLLAILSDITAFKRDETCRYRVALYNAKFEKAFLAEGVIGHAASESISGREKQILHLIAEGLTEKEIAERLFISVQTVKTHRKNLLRKTGVRNSMELIRYSTANLII